MTVDRPRRMHQYAPYPQDLVDLVAKVQYRPGWRFILHDDLDRGQGSQGATLDIITKGYNAYHPDRGEAYSVHHYMPVPPASYTRRDWQRWLFEQCLLVERHEAMEFFSIDGGHPYAPTHGDGHDPYTVVEYAIEQDRHERPGRISRG